MQALQLLLNSVNSSVWLTLAGLVYLGITLSTAIHVLLNQQREGSAIAWLGIIFLSPGLGIVVYWLLGINRIKRRARREFLGAEKIGIPLKAPPHEGHHLNPAAQYLMTTGRAIHADVYVDGNQLQILDSGDQAYPAMLAAIDSATDSVFLSSYIFDYDDIGRQFIEALGSAHQRGVVVRVMIDGVGIGYSFSWIKTDRALRARGISTARFLPTLSRRGTRFINLRNHRKILSIDGKIAFVGGINIRDANLLNTKTSTKHKNRDLHFQLTGPVIKQVNSVFLDDWLFACGETLAIPPTDDVGSGSTICRVLPDGPDENYLKLQTAITAAINAASKTISIVTPYFLPGSIVLHALKIAVLRGVKVQVIVPKKSNIRFIDWAFRAELKNLLANGIEVYFSPDPFDHSKLFLVDDYWCLIGSSNWDSRSLRLNFEVNVECYDQELNAALTKTIVEKRSQSNFAIGLHSINQSLPARLRNSFCRLFSPYL
ncbi:MAG: PLDc N-terminal domain-containing protein [Granulosicoccus sp.]|nr:PLDc N-terminal domain-containing protein [Granulosicoccus sp.]